jgi:sterol desaturase/sphingolipid hydroxylase (fatty acid hydroxylase superfamily)
MLEFLDANPLTAVAGMFQDPRSRWFVLYLATSLGIAYVLFRAQARHDPELTEEGFFGFAFPKEIYGHASAKVDYWFYGLNKLLFAAVFASTALLTSWTFGTVKAALAIVVDGPLLSGHAIAAAATTTILYILIFDFALWLAHYLFHRVPLLWEFHKVHHSAEVLTPFSAGRVHPIDDLVGYAMTGLFGGTIAALCDLVFGPEALVMSPLQLHVVMLAFFLFGFHLRHSHVWLPYTGMLGRILISPAHHQVHHSSAERHWDRNMGFIFAFWDWIFGTLHVPEKRQEQFPLGIGGEEKEFNSVWRLYALPFAKGWRRIARRRARRAAARRQPSPKPVEV